jgi:AraC family transcriptional regulator of adaptative response/methylated-DNA-[protein]-cysteine methyltransferase
MICAGALDDDGIEALADRLGIGARHLDRLFSKHIGARPLQVAWPTRLQNATRLLDETKLPMAEIAARTGFASRRRFNAVFAEVYEWTPTQTRRTRFKSVRHNEKGPTRVGPFRRRSQPTS